MFLVFFSSLPLPTNYMRPANRVVKHKNVCVRLRTFFYLEKNYIVLIDRLNTIIEKN